jgi:hypothetical protein
MKFSAEMELPTCPPCICCKYWKPEKLITPQQGFVGAQFTGIRLCWAEHQFSDFSCYSEKKDIMR